MAEILVEIPYYKKAKSPDELYSGDVGPCIVIGAIYEKKGYMIHQPPLGPNYFKFIEPFFRDLEKDVKDKNKLQIYVIGGEIIGVGENDLKTMEGFNLDYKECKEDIEIARKIVLYRIEQYKFQESVKEIRWCPENYAQNLRLILSESRAEIEEKSLEDIL